MSSKRNAVGLDKRDDVLSFGVRFEEDVGLDGSNISIVRAINEHTLHCAVSHKHTTKLATFPVAHEQIDYMDVIEQESS